LPSIVTLDGADDGGVASPVDQQGHTWFVAVGGRPVLAAAYVIRAEVCAHLARASPGMCASKPKTLLAERKERASARYLAADSLVWLIQTVRGM